jgi:predicted ribosome quality control (RQC) complex YloA/Tae2 family protein
MEAITLRAVAGEIERHAVPSRVAAVSQATPLDVTLTLRGGGERLLVISVRPDAASFHLAPRRGGNLPSPTAFCRLLRKRLVGLILAGVGRRGLERAVDLFFASSASAETSYRLAAEIMGRWSNLVLTEEPSGVIVDSLQHVPGGVSRLRAVLPGETYLPPPRGGRLDPTETGREAFVAACRKTAAEGRDLAGGFVGLGPGLRRIAAGGSDDCGALYDGIMRIVGLVDGGDAPGIIDRRAAAALPLTGEPPAGAEVYAAVSAAAAAFYEETAEREERRRLESALRRTASRAGKRLRKKVRRLEEEAAGGGEDRLQEAAGAILSSLASIARGATRFTWTDAAGEERSVELDPALSPRRNAEVIFKKVRKARRRAKLAQGKIPAARAELAGTEEFLAGLQDLSLHDLRSLAKERGGPRPSGRRRTAPRRPPVREYRGAGWRILVGKSSRGNDELTTKIAKADDTWLHTRDFAGAHVVIKGDGDPPEEIIRAAGEAAAWHSAARSESAVDVAYTKRRHVRKVKGQAPGQVLVSQSQTIRVRPRVPEGFDEVRPGMVK